MLSETSIAVCSQLLTLPNVRASAALGGEMPGVPEFPR